MRIILVAALAICGVASKFSADFVKPKHVKPVVPRIANKKKFEEIAQIPEVMAHSNYIFPSEFAVKMITTPSLWNRLIKSSHNLELRVSASRNVIFVGDYQQGFDKTNNLYVLDLTNRSVLTKNGDGTCYVTKNDMFEENEFKFATV